MESKAKNVRASLAKTRERRKTQDGKAYALKVDKSHLGSKRALLDRLFLEAKWFSNHALEKRLKVNYKTRTVRVKVGNCFEERNINVLPSQVRQELLDRMKDDVRSLHAKKVKGYNVGKLKFKKAVNSIPLKQCGVTYLILGSRVRVQGVGWLRVNGAEQIGNAEVASATLIRRHGDYYLHVSTFAKKDKNKSGVAIGLDLGIKNQATFSNCIRVNYAVPLPKRLRGLYKKWSRTEKGSKNREKVIAAIEKEFERHTNRKRDIRNKMFHFLKANYQYVAFQNDCIAGWQRLWGRRMLASSIGGFRSTLFRVDTPIEVPRSYASTQTCSECCHKQPVGLDERVFKCERCSLTIDRDLNSAIDIERYGLRSVGVTPVEKETATQMLEYFNSIPRVRASLIVEAGSSRL